MKIVDLQVIPFRVPRIPFNAGKLLPETTVTQTLTKVITDEGAEGYYLGGAGHGDQDGLPAEKRAALEGRIKSMVVGHDPFDREKFWHWMWVANVDENLLSVLDLVLWDLQARAFGVPVHKLLGGCRDRVEHPEADPAATGPGSRQRQHHRRSGDPEGRRVGGQVAGP